MNIVARHLFGAAFFLRDCAVENHFAICQLTGRFVACFTLFSHDIICLSRRL